MAWAMALSASCGPSRKRAATFFDCSRLASHLVWAAFTLSGFSYAMIMSFSCWRMAPISPRSSAMWLTSANELAMKSSLMAWMRNMPSMPAPPNRPNSPSTTPMAPSIRKRMVKSRMSDKRFMVCPLLMSEKCPGRL